MKRFPLTALLFTFLLTACAPEEPQVEEKLVKVPQNTWGVDFDVKPVSKAGTRTQEWGKAVVTLDFIQGGSGTGFFISEDGLLLTNHHLISRERCSQERCAGVRLIRHFTPNGDMQVYHRFKVLAHNKTLDYALLQVELQEGEKTPFLPMAQTTDWWGQGNEMSLSVLGHPFGGSLHITPAKFYSTQGAEVRLHAVSAPGNSGSPVVDHKSGQVVGILWGGGWDSYEMNRQGGTKHFSSIIDIEEIRKSLDAAFVDYKSFQAPRRDMFTKTQPVKDVLPETREFLLKSMDSTRTFIGQALGTPEEAESLEKLLSVFEDDSTRHFKVNSIMRKILLTQFGRNSQIEFSTEQVRKLTLAMNTSEPWEYVYVEAFKQQHGMKTCSPGEIRKRSLTSKLRHLVRVCHSNTTFSGKNVINELHGFITGMSGFDEQTKEGHLMRSYQTLAWRSRIHSMTGEERSLSLKILEKIIKETNSLWLALSAERLHTLVQRDSKLLAPGSFSATF